VVYNNLHKSRCGSGVQLDGAEIQRCKSNQEWGAKLVDDNEDVNENTPGAVKVFDVVEIMRVFLEMSYSDSSMIPSNQKVVVKVDIMTLCSLYVRRDEFSLL